MFSLKRIFSDLHLTTCHSFVIVELECKSSLLASKTYLTLILSNFFDFIQIFGLNSKLYSNFWINLALRFHYHFRI